MNARRAAGIALAAAVTLLGGACSEHTTECGANASCATVPFTGTTLSPAQAWAQWWAIPATRRIVNRGAPPGYTLSSSLVRVILPRSWISHSSALCSRTSLGWNNECARLASGPAVSPELLFLHVTWARAEPVDLAIVREPPDGVRSPSALVDLGHIKRDPEAGHFVLVQSTARTPSEATHANTRLVG